MLETFRDMVNDAIRICLQENIRGRLSLKTRIYKEFRERYCVVSCFPYSVAEVAWSIVKKHRKWQRKPFAQRLMMKMDVDNYSLNHSTLSIPFRRGKRVLIPLSLGDYQLSFLLNPALKRGAITITDEAAIIPFSRKVSQLTPIGRIGIDINEKSVACSDGTKYDLSEVARLHTEHGVRRSEFSRSHPKDRRVKEKYSFSTREKESQADPPQRFKQIVETAKRKGQSIVLERLKGIRFVHLKGNWEGKGRRRRIAQWPFRQLQTYISYKAQWEGVQVEFVSAALTSQTCHKCLTVNRALRLFEREWLCPSCGATLDRDLNAAINIERRGKIPCLGEVRPRARSTDEAVKGNEQPTAPILRAEAPKLA